MPTEPISFDVYHPQPLIVVISGPSGAGKDAVVKELKNRHLPFHFVVTATTRPPRKDEQPGVDYFFVSKEQFQKMIQQGELIEYALVYEDYKGIPKSQVDAALQSGLDVILRLDVQGASRIRSLYPQAVLIFLIPASPEEWLQRLANRKSESSESLRLRQETARSELACLDQFDYVVVNADGRLAQAADAIIAIITAEHHSLHPCRKRT